MHVLTGSWMAAEMAEQPAALERLIERRGEIYEVLRRILPSDLRGTAFVGQGSSGHAALFARSLFEPATRRPALVVPPSLINQAAGRIDYGGFLAVSMSQSGYTPDVVRSTVLLRRAGARGLAVTAAPASPLASVAEEVVDLGTGDEVAVPATKSFTASLAAVLMLAEAAGAVPWSSDDWTDVPGAVAGALADEATSRDLARELAAAGRVLVLAEGPMLAVARETALKLQETAGILALAESADTFRHGPIALAGRDLPVVVFAGSSRWGADAASVAALLSHLRVPVSMISAEPGADLALPPAMPESLAAVVAAVRGQQLARFAAEALDIDPDRPPYVRKVVGE